MPPITFNPIGTIHTAHRDPDRTPIQPVFATGCEGWIDLLPQYAAGLKDLAGFSHVYLIYHFDRSGEAKLLSKPFLDTQLRGVFASRSPHRPNAIGLSIVRLVKITGCRLDIADVDILDNTPLLDIKPFIARFDNRLEVRSGWQDQISDEQAQTIGRRLTSDPTPE